MSEATVLYYHPTARARVAHWMLEEIGIPYRLELVHFEDGDAAAAKLRAIHPMGEVPALIDHGTVITEAAAICAYLADNYPRAQLAPALHEPARAAYLRWLFFAASRLEPALAERERARPLERTCMLGAALLDQLESALRPGPYLLEDRFSAADVYVGSQIGAGLTTQALEPRPTFLAYMARLHERPAFQRISQQAAGMAETLKNG